MSERQVKPVPHPRKLGPCAIAVLDELQLRGVTHPQFFKTHHARVEFVFAGRALKFYFACTPRCADTAAKRTRAQLQKLMGVRPQ